MENYTADMTLEEQIGQLLMVGFDALTPTEGIIDLIQNYAVGGIIFFSRNIQDTQQVFTLTQKLQEIAKAAGHRYPLLIAIDQENGIVRRLGEGTTILPGSMALGATGSEQITYEVAEATGRELKALGINMNLAPVVDVNNNPANPVIGVRSFGEDPHAVARLGSAAVKGYRAAGVISTLKHFPGHGDTAVDSHLALPVIPYSLERLEAIELVPFRSGIAAGADSVMIAHVALPALMPTSELPATVSPEIVRGLLRQKLGFEGVVISDCMEMSAIVETVGAEQGTVMSLQAGVDLVLVSHLYPRQKGSLEAVYAAVETGKLSREEIREAAERVLTLKQRFLSWETLSTLTPPLQVETEAHRQLRDRAYELSTIIVRNEDDLLPLHLDTNERLVVVSPQIGISSQVEDKSFSPTSLLESIQQRHSNVISLSVALQSIEDDYEEILQATTPSDTLIVVTVNAHLDARQAELMRHLLQAERRIIGIAVYNPYDLLVFPALRTYLVTYEYTQPALAAAVRVFFGEIHPRGQLPVSFPGL